ncbi:MAG: uroporphyrinogen-III synthase [Candidatus Sphingomonas phytovorans]|nr:uroporphyrinogen-III synthase [Sphingomonas sp.]WEJ98997.1 MAG: uroporphyrinogen-III synthase [Sphingomonas sp.]
MTPAFAVLRPEPGNAATAGRIEALGLRAIRLPLFEIRTLDWAVLDPAAFDALLLTSANAVHFGGVGLDSLRHLPVLAVGARTAEISRAAGFDVMAFGESDAAALLARDHGIARALHLGGRERSVEEGGWITRAIAVYASEPLPVTAAQLGPLEGSIALLHSARAAIRLGELAEEHGLARSSIAIAAFSPAVASAAGSGWKWVAIAAAPNDAALIEAARTRLTG